MAEWVNGVIRSRQESTDSLDSSSARTISEEYENSDSEENTKDDGTYDIDDFSIIKTIGKFCLVVIMSQLFFMIKVATALKCHLLTAQRDNWLN